MVDQIERLMQFISGEHDMHKLSKRRINGCLCKELGKQAFLDLVTLADFRETLLRKTVVLSPIYLDNASKNVATIERTMPPQYQAFIVQRAVANNA